MKQHTQTFYSFIFCLLFSVGLTGSFLLLFLESSSANTRNRRAIPQRAIIQVPKPEDKLAPAGDCSITQYRPNRQVIRICQNLTKNMSENQRSIFQFSEIFEVFKYNLTLIFDFGAGVSRYKSTIRFNAPQPIKYKFPCTQRLPDGTQTGIKFELDKTGEQGIIQQDGGSHACTYSKIVLDQPNPGTRRSKTNNFHASATKHLASFSSDSSSPERALVNSFHCTALSDLGTRWGVYASRPGTDDQVGWSLFSPNDPCARAIQDCERNPGLSCSVVNAGEQPISGKEVMVSLQCLNQNFLPVQYAKIGVDTAIPTLLQQTVGDARSANAHSCVLEVSDLNTVIVSPSRFDALGGALIKAKVEDGKIITTTVNGEATILSPETVRRNPGPNKSERMPRNWEYLYDEEGNLPEDCNPIPPARSRKNDCYRIISTDTRQEIVSNEPVKPLMPFILRRDDVGPLLTVSEKLIHPWATLGFYLDFQQNRSQWRAIAERQDFRIARKQVRRRDPKLAVAYIEQSLRLLLQQSPPLGEDLLSKVSTYLKPMKENLVMTDLAGVAGLNTEKNTLNPKETLEQFVRGYVQECQTLKSSALKCDAPQKVSIAGQDSWLVRSNVTLQSAFGFVEGGERREPPIGAGQIVNLVAKDGEPVDMVQTTYFVPDYTLVNSRDFFVIDFITTRDRAEQYQEIFAEIIQSFRFIRPIS